MKRNRALIIIALLVIITAISALTVRASAIEKHDWKVTSGVDLKNDFINFSKDSVYSYTCPLIREDGDIIAIALFKYEGRLLVFSTKDMAFSFLMYI